MTIVLLTPDLAVSLSRAARPVFRAPRELRAQQRQKLAKELRERRIDEHGGRDPERGRRGGEIRLREQIASELSQERQKKIGPDHPSVLREMALRNLFAESSFRIVEPTPAQTELLDKVRELTSGFSDVIASGFLWERTRTVLRRGSTDDIRFVSQGVEYLVRLQYDNTRADLTREEVRLGYFCFLFNHEKLTRAQSLTLAEELKASGRTDEAARVEAIQRWRDLGRGHLVRLAITDIPPAEAEWVVGPVEPTARLFLHVPTKAMEFEATMGRKPTASDQAELRRAARQVDNLAGFIVDRSAPEGELRSNFEKYGENIFIFVGHNDKGRFRFLNGTSRPMREVVGGCMAAQKACVFLACHSSTYTQDGPAIGVSDRLNFVEALHVAAALGKQLSAKGGKRASMADVRDWLSGVTLTAARRTRVMNVALRASEVGGAAFLVALLVEALDELDEWRDKTRKRSFPGAGVVGRQRAVRPGAAGSVSNRPFPAGRRVCGRWRGGGAAS